MTASSRSNHDANGGRGSRWLLGVLAIAAVWWTVDLVVLRAGVPHVLDDHWEDHLVASQLLRGEGFRTTMIYPPLWGLRDTHDTVPVLVHGPLMPILTAPLLAVLGRDRLDSVAGIAALAAVLALIPLFRVGARSFGPAVGAAAAGLFTFSPLTLEAVHHAGSVVVGACLMVWALDLVARPAPRALAAGVVTGLAYLTRPEALVALPVLGWLAWRPRSDSSWSGSAPVAASLRAILGLGAGFVVVALPWWIHHGRAVGNPLFNLSSYTLIGFWGPRPDMTVMLDFALTPERWPGVLRAELPRMPPKWVAFFPRAIKHVLFFPSGATGWLAPIGLFAAVAAPRPSRRLAISALALVLVPVAAMTLTSHQPLYLVTFSPLLALGSAYGASVVASLLPERLGRPRVWLLALAVLMAPSAVRALVVATTTSRALDRRLIAERDALARNFPPGASGPRVIFTDTPDFVAWTTGRPAIMVFREHFDRLYPAGRTGEAAEYRLPPPPQVAGWFHERFRDPESLGERIEPGRTAP